MTIRKSKSNYKTVSFLPKKNNISIRICFKKIFKDINKKPNFQNGSDFIIVKIYLPTKEMTKTTRYQTRNAI
jgi:apolipoprotein N-acyltransferase